MTFVQSRLRLDFFRSGDLIRRAPQILTRYGQVMDQELKRQIKEKQYYWPRETKRYGKGLGRLLGVTDLAARAKIRSSRGFKPFTVAGTTRDIVDSGNFLRSQLRQRINGTTIRFSWGGGRYGVTYAGNIYEGDGPGQVPRDWIRPALQAIPIERFFAQEWRRLSGSGL